MDGHTLEALSTAAAQAAASLQPRVVSATGEHASGHLYSSGNEDDDEARMDVAPAPVGRGSAAAPQPVARSNPMMQVESLIDPASPSHSPLSSASSTPSTRQQSSPASSHKSSRSGRGSSSRSGGGAGGVPLSMKHRSDSLPLQVAMSGSSTAQLPSLQSLPNLHTLLAMDPPMSASIYGGMVASPPMGSPWADGLRSHTNYSNATTPSGDSSNASSTSTTRLVSASSSHHPERRPRSSSSGSSRQGIASSRSAANAQVPILPSLASLPYQRPVAFVSTPLSATSTPYSAVSTTSPSPTTPVPASIIPPQLKRSISATTTTTGGLSTATSTKLSVDIVQNFSNPSDAVEEHFVRSLGAVEEHFARSLASPPPALGTGPVTSTSAIVSMQWRPPK